MIERLEDAPLSPTAAAILREMYAATALRGTVAEEPQPIDSMTRISVVQGSELNRLVRESGARRTLEIGLAYGFSTVWILDALGAGGSHTAIDPFQRRDWGGIGEFQAQRLTNGAAFTLVEDYSIHALSALIKAGERFDFLFIDGNHRFDDVLVDFYLADQAARPGALIAFDDLWMPSIRMVVRFVLGNRDYEAVPQAAANMLVMRKRGDDARAWTDFAMFGPSLFSRDWRASFKDSVRGWLSGRL